MGWWDDFLRFIGLLRKPSLPPPPPLGVSKVNLSFSSLPPSFYSPSIIKASNGYTMWVTDGDRVGRFQSVDGAVWTGGEIVMSAIKDSWEDDGGNFLGYTTGLSDPRVVKGVTPGYAYTMIYSGGRGPNTETSGGIATAVSNDGIYWDRVGKDRLRYFVGGNCFMTQLITIRGKLYLYYSGAPHDPPRLTVAEDVGNGYNYTNDKVLTGAMDGPIIPLFYDQDADSCWLAVGSQTQVASGPVGFDIYKGSDGFTTLGTKIATIDLSITGNPTNFGPQALHRDEKGMRVGKGSDPVQLIFSSGNMWGSWKPASVIIRS